MAEETGTRRMNRRSFLKYTATLAGAGVGMSALAACTGAPASPAATSAPAKPAATSAAPAAAATAAPAVASAPKELLIGQMLPLSGGGASVGSQMRAGAEVATDEINAEGGIKALGGAKLKLVFGDSKSTPDGGSAETERLAVNEKVLMMIGSYQSSVTFPSTAVAERYKTVFFVNVAAKLEITVGRGFKYVFRDFKTTDLDAANVLGSLAAASKAMSMGPKSHALLVEGTDWGRSTGEGVKKLLKKYLPEAQIVMEEVYPPNQSDFTAQILKVKSSKADFLHIAMYTTDHIIFSKQVMEQKLDLPYGIVSFGAGGEDPTMYAALPPASYEYMFVEEDWDVRAPSKPWYEDVNGQIKPKLGYDMSATAACGYGAMYVTKDVLERAAYDADLAKYRDNIRDAFAKTDLKPETALKRKTKSGAEYSPAFIRGVNRIMFDEHGQNPYAYGCFSQIKQGKRTLLVPTYVNPDNPELVEKPIWPIPKWSERGV